jgi:predicted lipid carrier protein YhbT
MRRHSDVGERLAGLAGRRLLLDPTDLPLAFVLELTDGTPRVEIIAQGRDPASPVHATVSGSLADLTSLAEGRIDGDALFFSRRLTVSGEMELIVAIRNALDGAGIELGELLAEAFGPFRPFVRRILQDIARSHARLDADLSLLSGAVTSPLRAELARLAAELDHLRRELDEARRHSRLAQRR